MYLMALGWLVFPVYGGFFAAILPTADTTLRWAYPIAAIYVQLGWLWSGSRGGPMMVSRASLVHELGAAVSPRTVLAPQLLRQAVGWGVGGAAVGGVFTSLGDDYAFSTAFSVSAAAFLLLFGAVPWALVMMVGVRQAGLLRTLYLFSSVAAALCVTATVLIAQGITGGVVLGIFGVVTVAGAALAWHALDNIPVPTLWERSRNLESARSAMLEVDFHRMMADLRTAGEGKAEGTTRLPGKVGLSWWRCIAPLRHALPWSAIRVAANLIAGVLLVVFAPLDQGVVLLAVGTVWLAAGYELTRGLAALADQVAFFVHYPRSSFPLLVGQLFTSLALGVGLILIANGWRFSIDGTEAIAVLLIALMGIIGGAMQARLGSPDTTALVAKHGLDVASAALWARAAAGPLAVVVAVVLVFHGLLEPLVLDPALLAELELEFDPAGPIRGLLAVLFLVVLAVCLKPFESVSR